MQYADVLFCLLRIGLYQAWSQKWRIQRLYNESTILCYVILFIAMYIAQIKYRMLEN